MNREINYSSIFYEILGLYIIMKILSIITPIITLFFFISCCSKNTLICKLDLVYRYIVGYIMRKPVYGHFTHILPKENRYIESFCYNTVGNHFYTKFGKKKKNLKL